MTMHLVQCLMDIGSWLPKHWFTWETESFTDLFWLYLHCKVLEYFHRNNMKAKYMYIDVL